MGQGSRTDEAGGRRQQLPYLGGLLWRAKVSRQREQGVREEAAASVQQGQAGGRAGWAGQADRPLHWGYRGWRSWAECCAPAVGTAGAPDPAPVSENSQLSAQVRLSRPGAPSHPQVLPLLPRSSRECALRSDSAPSVMNRLFALPPSLFGGIKTNGKQAPMTN